MNKVFVLATIAIAISLQSYGQSFTLEKSKLTPVNVQMSFEKLDKKAVVKVTKDSTVKEIDEATFVRLNDVSFQDGAIEVDVLSRLAPNATPMARGFIGVAFRINDDNSKFECFYIRPTNGRAEDQVRRNHSIQYFSYPDFKFPRLRKELPEKYESYADMGLNEWLKLKIVVKGKNARFYINDSKQPSLVVTDLKLDSSGGIGLFVDVGTEGYFSNIKISK